MTKDEINIAIAEYCGWKKELISFGISEIWIAPIEELRWDHYNFNSVCGPPDFHRDLNLMFKAEESLKYDDLHASACYNVELLEKFEYTVSISAADRAEMFVKVIGRWEGEVK